MNQNHLHLNSPNFFNEEYSKSFQRRRNFSAQQSFQTDLGQEFSKGFTKTKFYEPKMGPNSKEKRTQNLIQNKQIRFSSSKKNLISKPKTVGNSHFHKPKRRHLKIESPPDENQFSNNSNSDSDFIPNFSHEDKQQKLIRGFSFEKHGPAESSNSNAIGEVVDENRPSKETSKSSLAPISLKKEKMGGALNPRTGPANAELAAGRDLNTKRVDLETCLKYYRDLESQYKKWQKRLFQLQWASKYMHEKMRELWDLIQMIEQKNMSAMHGNAGRGFRPLADDPGEMNLEMEIDCILDKQNFEETQRADQILADLELVPNELVQKELEDELGTSAKLEKPLGRVPYVLGKQDQYVLIQLNREKPKSQNKISPEAEKKFEGFWVVFKKIFWNEEVTQDELDVLSQWNREILVAVLAKKGLIGIKENVSFEVESFNNIIQKTGHKRSEQNLKYVYKFILKFLRTQFKNNHTSFQFRKINQDLTQKQLVDLAFYTFYFGQIADENDWPISKFYSPKGFPGTNSANKSVLDSPDQQPRSLNKDYFQNLKKSELFIRDVSYFLNNRYLLASDQTTGIIHEYKKSSENKMVQKLNQWVLLLSKNGQDEGLKRILDDLNKNPKSKLPWSLNELNRAVDAALDAFSISKIVEQKPE